MGYEDDFVNETPVEITIGKRIFKYKPTTSGNENDWLKDTMYFDPVSKLSKLDWGLHNIKKLSNIVEVPYTKEEIKKLTGLDKDWKDFNENEKYNLFKQLKAEIFDKLIVGMKNVDSIDEESLKN